MRKIFMLGVFSVLSSFLIFSCGKKEVKPSQAQEPIKPVKKVQNQRWADELKNAPAWVLNPKIKGKFAAVGSAKIIGDDLQYAKEEAMAHARNELARMINVKVKNMIKNFTQITGIGDEKTVDKVSVHVSKQISYQVLQGSEQEDMWISPNGTLYVLVVLNPENVKDFIKQETISSFKKDKALWQQFQSKKAFEELEKEIEKEFSRN